MSQTDIIDKVKHNLSNSTLINKTDILNILETKNWKFDLKRETTISKDILLETYKLRADWLAQKSSKHSIQLYQTVTEFYNNLKNTETENLFSTQIKIDEETHFVIFLEEKTYNILGCLKVKSKIKMSQDRWESIWRNGEIPGTD